MSVSINVSHSSLVCGEAWGTEPHFSWLYEHVAITSAVGTVSKDGTTLYVTKSPFCGQFTCTVSNKLGHSTATYTAGECGFMKDNLKGKSASFYASDGFWQKVGFLVEVVFYTLVHVGAL